MTHHIARRAPVLLAVGALLAAPRPSAAQAAPDTTPPRHRWELLGSSGTLVPTGALADAITRAPISTAQVSYLVRERLAVTTVLGWARARDVVSGDAPRVSIFTYDVGAEARTPSWSAGGSRKVMFFAGAGAGGRSYDHRDQAVDATHALAAYAAVGADLGVGRAHLRLEARDYVTGFRPLAGGGAVDARNDVVVLAGLRLARRPAQD